MAGFCEGLCDGGVGAFVVGEGFFDVDDEGVAGDFAEGDGNYSSVCLQESADLMELFKGVQQLFCAVEFFVGDEGVFGVLSGGVFL